MVRYNFGLGFALGCLLTVAASRIFPSGQERQYHLTACQLDLWRAAHSGADSLQRKLAVVQDDPFCLRVVQSKAQP